MFNKKVVSSVLFLSVLYVGSSPVLAETVVVVSAKSSATALTMDQVSDIFLGKSAVLPGGGQAVPVDQADGALREDFYHKATGKTGAQVKAFWSKQIFTGKGQPPKEVGDSAAVKALVANNPNLIGYIDKSALDGSVKSVLSVK
jgi:ABC-type phosphate transport system substrate-binding protein